MRHTTTTATLPAALREKYEITEPLEGGPVFALPHYGQGRVDFSTLDEALAEALIGAGFPYLRRRPATPAAEAPAKPSEPPRRPAKTPAAPDTPDTPDTPE